MPRRSPPSWGCKDVRVTVRVPATSANLGPGFDCFGLALDLCNEVIVDTDAEAGVEWIGEGADELPIDGTDLIRRSMRLAIGDRPLPSFHMRATNRVPLARGLGSSSAAVVAGVASALALVGDEASPRRVFALAAEIEGHPDNAAPACFGGFTIAMADGTVSRFDPHPGIRPVVLVPHRLRLPTNEARAALPPLVPRADAVFNVAHAALAVQALTRDPTLLTRALHDRLHEGTRLDLVPEVGLVADSVRAAGIAVCVSGAGPSLLAFPLDAKQVPDPGEDWLVLPLAVRASGFELDRS
jgi:homoserine kinase